MNKASEKAIEWLNILKTRPKMIIGSQAISYELLKTYLEGYIDGIGASEELNIRKEISLWFQEKVNQKASVYWTDHIPLFYKELSEDELKAKLLDITEAFFKEVNPE